MIFAYGRVVHVVPDSLQFYVRFDFVTRDVDAAYFEVRSSIGRTLGMAKFVSVDGTRHLLELLEQPVGAREFRVGDVVQGSRNVPRAHTQDLSTDRTWVVERLQALKAIVETYR